MGSWPVILDMWLFEHFGFVQLTGELTILPKRYNIQAVGKNGYATLLSAKIRLIYYFVIELDRPKYLYRLILSGIDEDFIVRFVLKIVISNTRHYLIIILCNYQI